VAAIERPAGLLKTRLGPTFDTSPNFVQLVHIPNLNPLTLSVRELSTRRTDGHGNLISPKAGLKKDR
jgi:hypothetical protein